MISDHQEWMQRLAPTALLSAVKTERPWITQVDSTLKWMSSAVLKGVSPSKIIPKILISGAARMYLKSRM